MTVELIPLFTMQLELSDPLILGATPAGTRIIVETLSGRIDGERLRGQLRGSSGADWLTVAADGTATLDVRLVIETDDGALIYMHYLGRSDFSKEPGSEPIYGAPMFETGDERYAWLNRVQAVAKGALNGTTLSYEILELR